MSFQPYFNTIKSILSQYNMISRVLQNYVFFRLQPFYLLNDLHLLTRVLIHCAAEVFIMCTLNDWPPATQYIYRSTLILLITTYYCLYVKLFPIGWITWPCFVNKSSDKKETRKNSKNKGLCMCTEVLWRVKSILLS